MGKLGEGEEEAIAALWGLRKQQSTKGIVQLGREGGQLRLVPN